MLHINDKSDNTSGATGQLSAAEWNDKNDEIEGVVSTSGQTLAIGKTPKQMSIGVFNYATGASQFQDSGTANAIVLTPITGSGGYVVSDAYTNEMNGSILEFFKSTVNTSATVTVNIGQTAGTLLGAKNVKLYGNVAMPISYIYGWTRLMYDQTNDIFVVISTGTNLSTSNSPNLIENLSVTNTATSITVNAGLIIMANGVPYAFSSNTTPSLSTINGYLSGGGVAQCALCISETTGALSAQVLGAGNFRNNSC